MPSGRRFTLPIDPWPRAALGERLAVTLVLGLLLLLPFCAAGAALLVAGALAIHVYRSYDLGARARALIRHGVAPSPPEPIVRAMPGRGRPAAARGLPAARR